jgi:methylglutaconyl-CoA hydratase
MSYASLTYALEGRTAVITLNRPERRNALNDVMIKELADVFTSLNRNTGSRTIVLTGAGASFCAGMDMDYLQKFSELSQEENLEDARNLSRMLQLVHHVKKPVIAMVNGPALGGGCGLAAACDFIFVAREKGTMGAPEVRRGFLPAIILMYLVKRMGEGAAKEFALRGDTFTAANAKAKGLATDIVDDDALKSFVFEFAEKLACSTSPSSVALTKDLFSRFDSMGIKDAMEYAIHLNALMRKTDDFKKGVDAFLKKDKLEW